MPPDPKGRLHAGAAWAGLNVLVLSPAPTAPLNQGNRRRIHRVCRQLQERGARITFVHYPAEDDWRGRIPFDAQRQMQADWHGYFLVPPTRPLHEDPKTGPDHRLDEWWDPAIGEMLEWLFRSERFDVFIVNYTWLSKALEFSPPGVLRILDTHDRFSGRRQVLEAHGIAPEFFHTTEEEEKVGLDRADVVWAIKHQEAEFFRQLTDRDVVTLIHAEPPVLGATRRPDGILRFGLTGARNKVNAVNFNEFLKAAHDFVVETLLPCEFVIAGSCCDLLRRDLPPYVRVIGRVPDMADFYRQVDVVLAPMSFSTGLKIKVGEALCHAKAVIAHEHAFEGYAATHAFHRLPSFRAMLQACREVVQRPELIQELERASIESLLAANAEIAATLQHTVEHLWRIHPGVCIFVQADELRAQRLIQDHVLEVGRYFRNLAKVTFHLDGDEPASVPAEILRAMVRLGSVQLSPRLARTSTGTKIRQHWPAAVHVRSLREVLADGHVAFWLAGMPDGLDAVRAKTKAIAYVPADAIAACGGLAKLGRLVEASRTVFADPVIVSRRVSEVTSGLLRGGMQRVLAPLLRNGQWARTVEAMRNTAGETVVFLADDPTDELVLTGVRIVRTVAARAVDIIVADEHLAEAGPAPGSDVGVRLVSLARYFEELATGRAAPLLMVDVALETGFDALREALYWAGIPALEPFSCGTDAANSGANGGEDPLRPERLFESYARIAEVLVDPDARQALVTARDFRASAHNDAGWSRMWKDVKAAAAEAA